jgi:methionyl-tRNA formyltransferase
MASGMDPSYFADLPPGEVPDCDWLISAGWPHIISADTLGKARLEGIGTHAALLPERRGGAPLNWALIDGLERTGVTIMQLSERVDAGDLVWQRSIGIGPDDDVAYLLDRVGEAFEEGFRSLVPDLLRGKVYATAQNPASVTYTRRRTPDDGCIDWHQTSVQIHNLVRGLARPFPGAWTHDGIRLARVWKTARVLGETPFGPPGTVKGDLVATGDYLLRLVETEGIGEGTRLLGAPRR